MKKCRSVYELEFFWLVHRVQSETMGCTKKKKKKKSTKHVYTTTSRIVRKIKCDTLSKEIVHG